MLLPPLTCILELMLRPVSSLNAVFAWRFLSTLRKIQSDPIWMSWGEHSAASLDMERGFQDGMI
jgi:hypothetical protein